MGKAAEKTNRVLTALAHKEPDRIPATEWLAAEFFENWMKWRKQQMHTESDQTGVVSASWSTVGESEELDPNQYYDLDMALVVPNSDPHFIRPEIQEADDYTIATSGFGCTIKKRRSRVDEGYMAPMAEYIDFNIKSPDDYEKFQFGDPKDPRRFHEPLQDIISGDGFTVLPTYMENVNRLKDDYCLVGGIFEAWEGLWRMRGIENGLRDLIQAPDKTKAFCERLIDFAIGSIQEQVHLSGVKVMYIWGDLGYKTGLLFSPKVWREIFFPPLKRLTEAIHKEGCVVIYHCCGHAPDATIEGLIEAGIDALNPLEVKAGMDALHIKRKFGSRLSIVGGIDNTGTLGIEEGNFKKIKADVLRVLNAAKGGGFIMQTDHCVPGSVPPANYDYMQQLRREYGNYPLQLGEYDEAI